MSQINQAVEKMEVEYVAFASDEKIRLTMAMVRNRIAVPAFDKESRQPVLISEREAMQFLMLCRARRLNPWEGDAFAIPFWDARAGCHKWSLITAHNAFLKRAEANKEFQGMESGVIVEIDGSLKDLEGDFVPDTIDGEKVKLVGGWAKVHRSDRKFPTVKRAKLTTYQQSYGRWTADAAGMIVKVSEADALRSAFPNTLGGMYLKEEQAVEVQASVEQVPERRPEMGPTPRALSRNATPKAEKTEPPKPPELPQGEPDPPAATSSQPAPTDPAPTGAPTPQANPEPEGQESKPDPEPEDLSTPPEAEETQTNQPPAFVPDPKDTVPTQDVKRLCHESGITVEMLMAWARAKKISTVPGQKLNELAETKLVNIKTQWATLLPIIKDFWAKAPK